MDSKLAVEPVNLRPDRGKKPVLIYFLRSLAEGGLFLISSNVFRTLLKISSFSSSLIPRSQVGPLWVWLVLAEVPARETFFGGAVILGTLVLRAAAGLRHGR